MVEDKGGSSFAPHFEPFGVQRIKLELQFLSSVRGLNVPLLQAHIECMHAIKGTESGIL